MPAHRLPSSSSSYSASHSRRRRSSCLLHPLPIIKPGLYTSSPLLNLPSLGSGSVTNLNRPIAFAPNITPGTYVEPGSDEDLAMLPPDGVLPPLMQDGSALSLLFPPSGGLAQSAGTGTTGTAGTAGTAAGRKRHPPGKRPSQGYIPRPPNAFMLFRADFVKQRHVPGSIETNHGSLSKIIGNCWRQLPLDEKHYWEQRAKEEKQQHKIKHPDYRFRPVHNKNKGKASSATTSSTAATSSTTSTSTSTTLSSAKGSKSRHQSSLSHSRTVSSLSTLRSVSSEAASAKAAAEEEELRCENVAQFLLEGKKGDELARAVRELDERRLVEREREALAEREREREFDEDEEMGMGLGGAGAGSLMQPQPGWSIEIERSLDESRPTSSRGSFSRGPSPSPSAHGHGNPFFAMPSSSEGFGSGSHSTFGFNSHSNNNSSSGFGGSYGGFTGMGMGGMGGMGGNSQFNAGLMLRRPSSVPLPTGDWLASFHNATPSHEQYDLAMGGQQQQQPFIQMPLPIVSPSPIAGISFAAQQHLSSGSGLGSTLLSTPLSSNSNFSMNAGGVGANGNGSNAHYGMLQRRPSSALASFASIDPSSFIHNGNTNSSFGNVNATATTNSSSFNTNANVFDSSYSNVNYPSNSNANASSYAYNTHAPVPRKSWTYNPSAVMYGSYETMPFLVDLGIENPYASKSALRGGVERGGVESAAGGVGHGQEENEGDQEEETAGEPDYTLFNDGFSFASGPSSTSPTITAAAPDSAPVPSSSEATSPLVRSSATSTAARTRTPLTIDPTIVDWSSTRGGEGDADPGLSSAATTAPSTSTSTSSCTSTAGGSPRHFGGGVSESYDLDLGGGGGMMMGEIDPLLPLNSNSYKLEEEYAHGFNHSYAHGHGHGHAMHMANHTHAHAQELEVDPLSMIGGDYSISMGGDCIDPMSM